MVVRFLLFRGLMRIAGSSPDDALSGVVHTAAAGRGWAASPTSRGWTTTPRGGAGRASRCRTGRRCVAPAAAGAKVAGTLNLELGKVIGGELRLPCGFLRRDPVGNLEPRKGRGLVTLMERPLERSDGCLDLNNIAGQFQDLVAKRRPRRSVNGEDLDGRAFAEHVPPAPEEVQASWGERRHA